jgi:pyruvate ferredoxin oxidoreductase delta subunit
MTEPEKRAAKTAAAKTTKPAARPAKPPARAFKAKKPKHWDISHVDEWGPDRHELGATIPEAGNSMANETGGWRTYLPVIDSVKCTGCMLCYFYCPDASIIIEGGKAVGVDLEHCKGCGICAKECPAECIEMIIEEKG